MTGDAEPRQIGSYEVLAKIADGGVGTVYLARRRGPAEFQRLVAVKRLHPQFAAAPSFVTMFTDEARLAARIHHANVVSIVELGADDDGYYVVMEYVEGTNLANFHFYATRGKGTMPRAVALRIALDALAGLQAAHELEDDDGTTVNLVHRDVSPQNILIGVDGVARLGDFGIARASALREFETRGAALKGKLEYMAPEQIECKEVDRTTDLFAMGIVLWELLTGRRLFPAAKSQVTTIQRVCFDPIPSPRTIDPKISHELERICMRALERPRTRRYPSAAAFAVDLEKAARADAGIATQREVAASMRTLLGDSLTLVRPPAASSPATTKRIHHDGKASNAGASAGEGGAAKGGAPAPRLLPLPDLGAAMQGKASTDQLPASDPMVKLSTSAGLAHPAPTADPIATEPLGRAPQQNQPVAVHYDPEPALLRSLERGPERVDTSVVLASPPVDPRRSLAPPNVPPAAPRKTALVATVVILFAAMAGVTAVVAGMRHAKATASASAAASCSASPAAMSSRAAAPATGASTSATPTPTPLADPIPSAISLGELEPTPAEADAAPPDRDR